MVREQRLSSRANPLLVALRRLSRDPAAYRRSGQVWLEGEHLCQAAAARVLPVPQALISESGHTDGLLRALAAHASRIAIVPDPLFAELSALESPGRIGFVLPLPAAASPDARLHTVVLDRLQDAGNVGSILRSAGAFGVKQVLALKGTVALWSPKVVRAAMGAHFGLQLIEGLAAEDLQVLEVPLAATSSHADRTVGQAALPRPLAWVLGHEGQGVQPALLQRCALTLRIPQPGGEESLNVAAAAAVCFYEAARQAG